ncbi:MAG: hypothetical protein ACOWWO_12365 [Peptococcaceae bacterium]
MNKKNIVIIILFLGLVSIYTNYLNIIPEDYYEKQIERLMNDVDDYSLKINTRSYAKIDNLNILHFKRGERIGYAIFEEKLLFRPRVKTIEIDNKLVYSFFSESNKGKYFIFLGENPHNTIDYVKIFNDKKNFIVDVDNEGTFIHCLKVDTENIYAKYYDKKNRNISNNLKITGVPIKSIYISNQTER